MDQRIRFMAGHDLITDVGIEGDVGTVTGVDGTGAVLVDWDSGAQFALTPARTGGIMSTR
ncbi:MAG: DUF4314 domain-containing protein [Actinomycetota bacterium]|nr:DUF4314 domain-containing protein [Actinomycetota bacterium]